MAAEISPEAVSYVANLARLQLTDEEIAHFSTQLSVVLDHVDAIRALDIADVPPTAHSFELVNVLREDIPRPGVDRDEVLAQAPAAEDGRFRVPRILGEAP